MNKTAHLPNNLMKKQKEIICNDKSWCKSKLKPPNFYLQPCISCLSHSLATFSFSFVKKETYNNNGIFFKFQHVGYFSTLMFYF